MTIYDAVMICGYTCTIVTIVSVPFYLFSLYFLGQTLDFLQQLVQNLQILADEVTM